MRILAVFCIGLLTLNASLAQERRELGAHQHGHGTLNIAIEGSRINIGLEVPGDDILGFEHAPKTQAQRSALNAAKIKLSAPLELFALPAAASCTVTKTNVVIEGGEQATKAKPAAEAGKQDHAHEHFEFRGDYELECASMANLMAIDFPYFRTFSRAQELNVNLITAKGQSRHEVTRKKPRLSLAGTM